MTIPISALEDALVTLGEVRSLAVCLLNPPPGANMEQLAWDIVRLTDEAIDRFTGLLDTDHSSG